MKRNIFNILIGGPAGSGIESAGMILGHCLKNAGASVVVSNEIMSLIRGGHNFNRVRFSFESEVLCHDDKVDLVVGFDKASLEHLADIVSGGVFVYDSDAIHESDLANITGIKNYSMRTFGLPLKKASSAVSGYINTLAIGVIAKILNLPVEIFTDYLKDKFAAKGEEVVSQNIKAFDAGFGLTESIFPLCEKCVTTKSMLLNGNDAICIGAVKSGCKFVAEYPMTPSSSILHTIAAWSKDYGIVVKHAEDEIAAMNMIVGAGFAGARSLTATSGGGFALMTEAVSLAGCSETPCVVVDAQRPGPSTGLPTRTEQGDLRQVLHAGQGDFPKLVMAPGDLRESFEMGFYAFNYAEKYQIPVFILTDKYLSETYVSCDELETADDRATMRIERGKIVSEVAVTGAVGAIGAATSVTEAGAISAAVGDFKRYADSMDGVSYRTLPGTKYGEHVATSYEHDEASFMLEDVDTRNQQMRKRMRKSEALLKELPEPFVINGDGEIVVLEMAGGADSASASLDILFVGFGSTKPILMEAVKELGTAGGKRKPIKAGILMIKYLAPFQSEAVKKILNKAMRVGARIVGVEQNFSGQLCGLICEKTGIEIKEKILKYDGRQMTAGTILEWVSKSGI